MTSHVLFMTDFIPGATKDSSILDSWNSESSGIRQIAIILGAIFLVAIVIILWAIFIRKPQPSSASGRTSERGMLLTDNEMKDRHQSRSFFGFGKRRKHRRRRSRSRNPTLAESGGLPPIREDEASEDFAP